MCYSGNIYDYVSECGNYFWHLVKNVLSFKVYFFLLPALQCTHFSGTRNYKISRLPHSPSPPLPIHPQMSIHVPVSHCCIDTLQPRSRWPLPLFLLTDRTHSSTLVGIFPSTIFRVCSYDSNRLCLMRSKIMNWLNFLSDSFVPDFFPGYPCRTRPKCHLRCQNIFAFN